MPGSVLGDKGAKQSSCPLGADILCERQCGRYKNQSVTWILVFMYFQRLSRQWQMLQDKYIYIYIIYIHIYVHYRPLEETVIASKMQNQKKV